jgi:iron complex outermembrane recepter protein
MLSRSGHTYTSWLIFLAIMISVNVSAQPLVITVKDSGREPLVGATVQLTQVADSASIFRITDHIGQAKFERVNNTLYALTISYIGFLTLEKSISVKPGQRSFEFRMEEDVITLGEVNIVARRPLIRQEGDKTIIDPEPLANISSNTLEVLEQTPGLFVDQDGNIFLGSATPASIQINGREQRMSSQDLTTILRSLPPGSIQRIEVIRTPSSRYDASSSGGIVNIVLKKGVKIGRFGSLSAGMNQGVSGNRFAGFSFNNSSDRSTSYLNLNYNRNGMVEDLNSLRFLNQASLLDQQAQTKSIADQGYLGYGVSYDASENLNLTYDGRINASLRRSDADNINLIQTAEGGILSENLNQISNDADFISLQQDLGLVYKLDTLGSEWDNKFSYSFSNNNASQDYITQFLTPVWDPIPGNGDNLQQRHFFLFQSDLTYRLRADIILETGIKGTLQDYDSRSDYFLNLNGDPVDDLLRTNSYNYTERIAAAYAQGSVPLPAKFSLKTGLRLEHTFMEGRQTIPADTSFVINRADLFPYVFVSRPLFSSAGFDFRAYMIYRRTISRPGYQSLNPYIRYVDEYFYEAGNPALKPQFSDNIEFNISFDDIPIFAVGRNYTSDIFSPVVYRDELDDRVAVQTYDNVGKSRETYFRAVGAIPPGGTYFFVAGAQYNHNEYDGFYEGEPLSFSRGSWRFFTFHSLNLTQNTRLTMFGFMMQNGQFNFYELNTFGQLNFGLNQRFFNNKLNITISARDVLRTMKTSFELNQGSMQVQGDRYTDNRRFGINIRYNFGIRNKEERQNIMRFDMDE